MELQHFSHPHVLTLSKEKNDDGEEIVCYGCSQKIFGFAYSCKNCSFFLHKLCAELPAEMTHPIHPEHPLTLLPRATYEDLISVCDVCDKDSEAFTYHCSLCDFDVDIFCAVRAQQNVEHEYHEHPLSAVVNPALFECYACGTKHEEGVSYMCNTCRFWIHEDCASLPTTIKHSNHIHPLKLIYTLVGVGFEHTRKCIICEKGLNPNLWVYCCKGCSFYAHVNCTTNTETKERKTAIQIEDIDETNLIHLPFPNESVSLIAQFLKQINLGDNQKREEKLNHFSHSHPLTFFNVHSNEDDLFSGSELSILNKQKKKKKKKKNDKICDACVQPIRTSFYKCSLCNFFLHEWCVELPSQLYHPLHQHPLILHQNKYFHCEGGCGGDYTCSGFVFQCSECQHYWLDVKCALLPNSIVHEVHEHPLFLKLNCCEEGCAACDDCSCKFSFGCDACNFNLHSTCALLPRTFNHRYDKHPFILTYARLEKGPDEYYCEFCEEEIDPKWWFYHCIDCDQSACAKCICEKEFPTLKLGDSFSSSYHPHPVTVVEVPTISAKCNNCHGHLHKRYLALKCVQCNIMVHDNCLWDE